MLSILLPHGQEVTTNPVFVSERGRLHWPRTDSDLKKYSGLVLIGTLCLAIGWWLLERLSINFRYIPPGNQYRLLTAIFFLGLACTLLSSLYTIALVISTVQYYLESEEWTIMRATTQGDWDLVEAHDAIAQIRSWRLSIAEVALRLATVVVFNLDGFYSYWFTAGQSFWATTIFSPYCWVGMAVEMTILGAYILEPLYRMKTIVALGIAIAVRLRSFTYSLLAGLLAITALHLLQIGAVFGILQVVLSASDPNADGIGAELLCVLPIGCLIAICIFFFFIDHSDKELYPLP